MNQRGTAAPWSSGSSTIPYGKTRHHFFTDIDNDGDVGTDDINTIYSLSTGLGTSITSANYIPDADINRDGVINGTDETIAINEGRHSALALGVLSHEDNIHAAQLAADSEPAARCCCCC